MKTSVAPALVDAVACPARPSAAKSAAPSAAKHPIGGNRAAAHLLRVPTAQRALTRDGLASLQRTAGNSAVAQLLSVQRHCGEPGCDVPGDVVQRDFWDDASDAASGAVDTLGQAASGVTGAVSGAVDTASQAASGAVDTASQAAGQLVSGAEGAAAGVWNAAKQGVGSMTGDNEGGKPNVAASILPGGSGDWHELAQAVTIAIAGLDLLDQLSGLANRAINEAGAVTSAGGDYGPQNALRHCIFAGLVTSHGWKVALREIAEGVLIPGLMPIAVWGALMGARIRIILQAHEWFADDGCGNFGTGTVDSECDRHNNSVGISIGGPFTSDEQVIAGATAALNGGQLLMTPGPTDLSSTVSTAGWPTSPWMDGGPQQPDCSKVVKK